MRSRIYPIAFTCALSILAGSSGSIKFDTHKGNKIINPTQDANLIDRLDENTEHEFSLSVFPEYQRNLETVILGFGDKRSRGTLDYQIDLINKLPSYSDLFFLVKEDDVNLFESVIPPSVREERDVSVLAYDSVHDIAQMIWTRDLFEIVVEDGEQTIVLPSYVMDERGIKRSTSFLVDLMEGNGLAVRQASIYFKGGNLMTDLIHGESVLFVGINEINSNVDYDPRFSSSGLSRDQVTTLFKEEFGVDRLVVMGEREQMDPLYHLDQSFTIVGPQEIVLLGLDHITDDDLNAFRLYLENRYEEIKRSGIIREESRWKFGVQGTETEQIEKLLEQFPDLFRHARSMLNGFRKTFDELGYQIHILPANLAQMFSNQSPVNVVPYLDDDGQRSVFVPVFPDEEGRFDAASRNNAFVTDFYEKLGFKVSPVEDGTWYGGGNIHCILNGY